MEIGVYLYAVLFLILLGLYLYSRMKSRDSRNIRQRPSKPLETERAETGEEEPKKRQ